MVNVGKMCTISAGAILTTAGLATAAASTLTGIEILARSVSKCVEAARKQELPTDFAPEKREWLHEAVDFRLMTRHLSKEKLLKTFGISLLATFIILEGSFRLFKAPIKVFNIAGRIVGLQLTNNGIWSNLNFSDWRQAFQN